MARLGRRAPHGEPGQRGGQGAADPVRRRVEVVHPVAPEDGELREGADDAVEEREHDEEEGEDVGDDGEAGREGADPLAPAVHEEEEEERHEEDVPRGAAVRGQARGEVPEDPVQDGAYDGHGELTYDLGGREGEPAVDAGGVLASLPAIFQKALVTILQKDMIP